MLQKLKKNTQKGFTLIEVMIVIAIIGILAAIAIPNFIVYRNKSFCVRAESDAQGIAGAIYDYFAIASHTVIPAWADLSGIQLSGSNTATIVNSGGNPSSGITITVTDSSGRCPTGGKWQGRDAAWSDTAPGIYSKIIESE